MPLYFEMKAEAIFTNSDRSSKNFWFSRAIAVGENQKKLRIHRN
ncbi:hypothetical protein [Nostoc sp. CALU 1950]